MSDEKKPKKEKQADENPDEKSTEDKIEEPEETLPEEPKEELPAEQPTEPEPLKEESPADQPTEEPQEPEKTEEPAPQQEDESKPADIQEQPDEEKPEPESKPEETETEEVEEPEIQEPQVAPEKPVETAPKKESKEDAKKKEARKDDFRYIVRIANTDLGGEKTVVHALTQIKGVGYHMAIVIADAANVDRNIKMGDLSDSQIGKINQVLENLNTTTPGWMLNHRKDYDTGTDIHLISSDVERKLRDDINVLKMIRSYRGIRHESGLPARGQRTRANSRKGLAMGVSKKREQT